VRTIAIINQKGGCGKTTVSINLAAVLASRGHKTLLVDMDPQSHCALGLAVPETQLNHSIGDMLLAGMSGQLAFSDVVWQISRNLDLAPSTMALAGVEQQLSQASDRDRRLAQVLSTVAQDYEYCIIDCPPSIGLLTFNALRAADEIIIPVETGYFSMQGAVRQEATIEMLARRAGHNARFSVLATMYDVRTRLAREILAELKRHFGDMLMPVVVNFNSKLKEAASFGQPITEYDPASRGMQDFEKLASWLKANPPRATEAAAVASATQNPAMSRAAELVERARALSARTAAVASRLEADDDIHMETVDVGPMQRPETPNHLPSRLPSAAQIASVAGGSIDVPPAPVLSQSQLEPAAPQRVREVPGRIAEQLARLHGVRSTQQGLLFVQPVNGAKRVAIAGDFNGWSDTATPMQRNEDLGVWQACVAVPPGRYHYRVVVDGQWMADPFNTNTEVNTAGEPNSVIEVREAG
jgi:chromosome partitioning protein